MSSQSNTTRAVIPEQDERWMREALALASHAESLGEVPVGAIIVFEQRIIARAHNRNITDFDPTGHAEMLALRQAASLMRNHRLNNCELYSTVEPCTMCAGALVHARIARLIYAAPDPKAGAAGSVLDIINHPRLNHKIDVTSGILAAESSSLLQAFFRARR